MSACLYPVWLGFLLFVPLYTLTLFSILHDAVKDYLRSKVWTETIVQFHVYISA